jgi:N-methylhydantoinase A
VTNSGPIGGAVAGSLIAKLAGYPNAITLDMGGTSCDVALIEDGEPRHIAESTVEGYPVQISTIDLSIVGAGGGSIAWIDKGRALRVGPHSAGADPGPACYSSGGSRPTVTDANLVAGRLSPEYFLGGEIQLDPEAALESIDEHIASKINLQPVEAALGIIQVANATMVRAIRLVSVERGYDPHDFALVAFGGAGPLHAVRLAEELEIPVVIVPRFPGNTSALGLVFADVRYDHVATRVQDLQDLDASGAEELFQGLERKALIQLSEQGIPEASRTLSRSCDMRYLGQAHELNVPFQGRFTDANAAQQIGDRFEYAHRRIHGHAMKGDPIVIVNFRVTAVGGKPQPNLRIDPNGHTGIQKGFRRVFFNETSARAAVFERAAMGLGSQIAGPAIIEQPDSTTLLHPGQIARVDAQGNLLITLTADGQESDGSKSDNS